MTLSPIEGKIAAARAVAARAGLGAVTPKLISVARHTSLRLDPLPIVARVRSSTRSDQFRRDAERELATAQHLASRGAPSVRPAAEVGAGPYFEGEWIFTLWGLVEGQRAESEADALYAAQALHALHGALADVRTELPSFTDAIDSCATILRDPEATPNLPSSDRAFLERLYAELRPELDSRKMIWRPLHGDAHRGNVLVNGSGATWMDLEAVCLGPLEWDLVDLPSSTWSELGDVDEDLMRLIADVRSLCVSVWCWADFDRSVDAAEAAIHHLAQLKARFS